MLKTHDNEGSHTINGLIPIRQTKPTKKGGQSSKETIQPVRHQQQILSTSEKNPVMINPFIPWKFLLGNAINKIHLQPNNRDRHGHCTTWPATPGLQTWIGPPNGNVSPELRKPISHHIFYYILFVIILWYVYIVRRGHVTTAMY